MPELTRKEQVMLYVIGTCNGLVDKGLMTGGMPLTERGRAQFEKLKASGFRPTDEECHWAMMVLTKPPACAGGVRLETHRP